MGQPRDFGFNEECALLKDTARRFFSDHLPVDRLHELVASNSDPHRAPECLWLEDLWPEMVELGWTMLAVPEHAGGLGMPMVAVAGLAEELGRAACPCPLLPTLNSIFVLNGVGEQSEPAIADILSGQSASLAIANRYGDWENNHSEIEVSEGKLYGTAWFVQDAKKVDNFLVSAKSASGTSLCWVKAKSEDIRIIPDAILDLTRDQAHVEFRGAEAVLLTSNGHSALNQALPAIYTILSADMVGAAEWQLQTTAEYVAARRQFDRPLGFFQAVKHPLVDGMIQIDRSKSLVYNAACAIDWEPDQSAELAHMAKSSANDMAECVSNRSIQLHGGIGFTWECFVHLYFKRQNHSRLLWGEAHWHRAKIADTLLGESG